MKLTIANQRLTLSTALCLSAFALNGCGGQPDDALDEVSLGAKPGGSSSTSITLTIASLASGLRLSWTSGSRPSSFKVLHSLDGVTYSQLASVSGRTTSYTHSGLESCVPHFYQVQACSTSSCGTPSNAVSGFATNQISVTSLLASLDGTNAAQLQWTASSPSDS
ncbi:MAG: hypothetical protein HYV07_08440, partial [Deltaproteobacteria bacterium]|nr:hypothetical protein [Deltaproteobacteria bacterium]